MRWQIKNVQYLEDYRLLIEFQDGTKKAVDLKDHIRGEIFEPLKDINYFKNVKLNQELDSIYWENGADFAPEFLYQHGTTVSDSTRGRR